MSVKPSGPWTAVQPSSRAQSSTAANRAADTSGSSMKSTWVNRKRFVPHLSLALREWIAPMRPTVSPSRSASQQRASQ